MKCIDVYTLLKKSLGVSFAMNNDRVLLAMGTACAAVTTIMIVAVDGWVAAKVAWNVLRHGEVRA